MRADFRLPAPQDASALFHQPVARVDNVVHFVAQVMNAPLRIPLHESFDGRIFAQGFDEFDLGVGEFDEHDAHAMFRLRQRLGNAGSESVAINLTRLGEVGNGDRHVIETSEHQSSSSFEP